MIVFPQEWLVNSYLKMKKNFTLALLLLILSMVGLELGVRYLSGVVVVIGMLGMGTSFGLIAWAIQAYADKKFGNNVR